MKIYDISQELTGSVVFPGDLAPAKEIVSDMAQGALYNLTNLHMCAHNGTHIDAPKHFIKDGNAVDDVPLEKFVGPCYVLWHDGDFTAQHVQTLIADKCKVFPNRILIAGKATVTADAALDLAARGIDLLGNESQTVGPEDAPMEVHKILLAKNVVLLEGIRLSGVEAGEYFLCAPPINISGCDGAPCRAILIKQ